MVREDGDEAMGRLVMHLGAVEDAFKAACCIDKAINSKIELARLTAEHEASLADADATGPMGVSPKQVYFSPKAGVATVSVNTSRTLSDAAHMGDVEGEGGG